jgi:uncharacterized protein (DUF1800 family)
VTDQVHADDTVDDRGADTADDDDGRPRWHRRAVLAGIAGTGAAAAGLVGTRLVPGDSDATAPRPVARRAARRPSDAGGFANRDESFASAAAPPQPAPAPAPPAPTLLYPTAGEAAAATAVTVPTILDTSDPVVHLLRRTTFGPTPAMVDEVHAAGIDGWLAAQLAPDDIPDPAADMAWQAFPLASAPPDVIRASIGRNEWGAMHEYSVATMARQVWSNRQLFEVMVDFWANHLNVPTPGPGAWDVGGTYQTGVIRGHALGSFTDMLLAAARHPAMLRYLSADQSTKDSVNENFGRELLELHTVGVGSGYTETDVRNSAYILTGRTVVGQDGPGVESTFSYDPGRHWVGPVTVLDFAHDNASAEGGLDLGDAFLRHLAGHPTTAQTIARKLAVRFVADMPPQPLVDRLATAYLDGGTAIIPVLDTLFRSAEFWASVGQKVRRPLENLVASARALGTVPTGDVADNLGPLHNISHNAGHKPLSWQAPNGYPDVHAAWRSAGGIVECWNAHRMLVYDWQDGLSRPDPAALVAGQPAANVGEFVDSLCRRLCFQVFQPPHRDALVAFLGGDPAAPIDLTIDHGDAGAAIALVLDSPYFALR